MAEDQKTCIETGVCAAHGAELERRKSDRERIQDMRTTLTEHGKYISELLTFKNKVWGIGIGINILGLVFLVGAYYYTYSHKVAADLRYAVYDSAQSNISSSVSDLRVTVAVVVTQMETNNVKLSELIDEMKEERRKNNVTNVRITEDDRLREYNVED